VTEADAALLVADDDERGETEARPPFTTLATRLMWTSLSTNSLSRSSRSRLRSRPPSLRSVPYPVPYSFPDCTVEK
jgi:hypothetical protein